MSKKLVLLLALIGLTAVGGAVWAGKQAQNGEDLNVVPDDRPVLILPAAADEATIVPLGRARDPKSGKLVEGYAIIHPKKGFQHKPGRHPGGGGGKCFNFLARDAKWKAAEPWLLNPANAEGLAGTFLLENLTANVAKWEDATDGTAGNSVGAVIFGPGSMTAEPLTADTEAPDGRNEVLFADILSPGAIAVTVVWGVFGGPPAQRELVEWDQVYDDFDFDWSSAGDPAKMDFENIAAHELGHSAGLGHPDDSCAEETMYRFSEAGETKKRDLNAGDVAGADALY